MAAKTPDSIKQEKLGTVRLLRAIFSTTNIDDGDTWTPTRIDGYVDHWFSGQSNPGTQASAGVHVAYSSGVFTFYPGEDNTTGTLFVLVRG